MNIFEKERRKAELEENIKYYQNEIKRLRDRQGLSATTFDKQPVQGGKRHNNQEELILRICQLQLDVDYCINELKPLIEHLERLEEIAEQFNDERYKIYKLKKEGLKVIAIADKMGMSESSIYRRLRDLKIDSNMTKK